MNLIQNPEFEIQGIPPNLFADWSNNQFVLELIDGSNRIANITDGGILSQSLSIGLANSFHLTFLSNLFSGGQTIVQFTSTTPGISYFPASVIVTSPFTLSQKDYIINVVNSNIINSITDYDLTVTFSQNVSNTYLYSVSIMTNPVPNIVLNPSFEFTTGNPQSWISSGQVSVVSNSDPPAHSGSNCTLLISDISVSPTLTQNLYFPSPGNYKLYFYIARQSTSAATTDVVNVTIVSTNIVFTPILINVNTLGIDSFSLFEQSFFVPLGTTNALLSFNITGGLTPSLILIDDVSVTKNLLENPEFEFYNTPNDTSSGLESWNVSGQTTGTTARPFLGSYSVSGNENGTLFQPFEFTVAGPHQLNFFVNTPTLIGNLMIQIGGITETSILIPLSGLNLNNYTLVTVPFTVPTGLVFSSLLIMFPDVTGPIYIDSISIADIIIYCYRADSLIRVKNISDGNIQDLPVKDVYSTSHLVYSSNKDQYVPIKFNVISGPTNKFRIIKKNAFGQNKPNNDLYITPGHKLMYNGILVKARNIPESKRIKHHNFVPVYSICIEENGPILVNGIETIAWGYQEWLKHAAKTGIIWKNNKNVIDKQND